jgi:ribonucleotide reductase alpha subunit
MNTKITVIKRDGRKEALNLDKIHRVVFWATDGLSGVSASELELKTQLQFFNNMKTKDIQETLIKAAADLISEESPNYQYVAGRLVNYALRKEVYNQYTPVHLYEHYKKVLSLGFYTNELDENYNEQEWNELNQVLNHERDMTLTYVAMEQFRGKYLVQNRVTGQKLETPQMTYMLIAMTLFMHYKKDRLKWVKDYYEAISKHYISLPTPVMAGVRTPQKQFSSCVLIETDDSLDSINATTSAIVKYVSQKAGIGIGAGRIRAIGSPVRNGDTSHTGVVPFYKMFQAAVRSCCVTPETWVEVINSDTTKIQTKRIQINNLQIGMKIKSYNPNTKEISYNTVTDKWFSEVPVQKQRTLTFDNNTVINCSENHPIMVIDGNNVAQVFPDDLKSDHVIVTESGHTTLKSISNSDNDTRYIDITVEDTHTFFVANQEHDDMILTHNSQGGVRNGAATLFYPIFHLEVEDLLVLKNNKGIEENRVRHMDYGVQFSRLFYQRLIQGGEITLFSPNDVPELYEAFFSDQEKFEELYVKAENNSKIRKKKVKALDLFSSFMQERKDTGRIYLMNVDHANTHSSFDEKVAPVRQSNLCLTGDTEIEILDSSNVIQKVTLENFVSAWNNDYNIKVRSFNTDTNEFVWSTVTNAGKTDTVNELVSVRDEYGNTVTSTPDHKIWINGSGWTAAKSIMIGDSVCTFTNNRNKVVSVETIQVDPTDVYDITVPETSAFVANNIVVHNCLEITLPTRPLTHIFDEEGRIALCTLSAINWGLIKDPHDFEKPCTLAVRGLDALLSYQNYPVKAAELATMEHRPLGIGIINFAYWLAKNNLKYTDDSALPMVDQYAEAWSYYLIKASVDLAKEFGPCGKPSDTKYAKGIVPIDTRKRDVDELVPHQERMPWDNLRSELKQHGIRNATLMALMPSECQSLENEIMLADGSIQTLENVLRNAGVNIEYCHENQLVGERIAIKPVDLPTGQALEAYYNGIQPVYEVTIEGNTYKFTGNHLLLVRTDIGNQWRQVNEIVPDDEIVSHYSTDIKETTRVTSVVEAGHEHTWDISTTSETYLLSNGCVSHNTSSQLANATNGIEPPRSYISIKQSKDGVLKQVVPEFKKLKNKYELLWDQQSPEGYIKICAILQKYIDQTISTNTSYNPQFYEDEKIPMSEMLKHLLMVYKYGLKTLYYFNTLDGQGEVNVSKFVEETKQETNDEVDCESCVI